MTLVVPSFIPVIVLARHRRIVRKFEEAGADRAERARTLGELDIHDQHLFGRMVRAGVLGTVDGARYFLNVRGLEQWRRRSRIAVLTAAAVVVLGLLVAFVFANA